MSGSAASPYVTNDQFRADFPAFKDLTRYQNASVTMYLTLAGNLLPGDRWGDLWIMGQELFAAHFLLLDQMDEASVSKGAATQAGPITNKSVGAVSVAYGDGAMEADAGHWNTTSFGRRLIRFARLVGMGGSQLIGDVPTPNNWFPGSATQNVLAYTGPSD